MFMQNVIVRYNYAERHIMRSNSKLYSFQSNLKFSLTT